MLFSFILLILRLQELSMLLLKDLAHFSCCLIHCIPQFIYPFSLQEYLRFFQFFIITNYNSILVHVLLGTYKITYPGYIPTTEFMNMHIFNIKSYCKNCSTDYTPTSKTLEFPFPLVLTSLPTIVLVTILHIYQLLSVKYENFPCL